MKRRALLQGMLVGGATLAVAQAATAEAPAVTPTPAGEPPPVDDPAPWWLIEPVRAGTYVGAGWTVTDLTGVADGAAVLHLTHRSGEEARVHLCRRHGPPVGLAHTDLLDLFLMNGGDGKLPTSEGLGRAVKTVALRIQGARQASALRQLPSDLISHDARLRRFGAPAEVSRVG